MGLFSGFFSKGKSINEESKDIKIKNQILEQPSSNQISDSYLNDTGNYKYNVETIPASDIDMSYARGMDSSEFWNHKGNTKEDYMNLASKLPQVQEELNSGKTLDEIKENPELSDCASAYYNPDKMVKIRENDVGNYEFEDDGRHRVAAAQELGYDIPIQNLSKPQEQTNNNSITEDDYTYNPEDKSFENNATLEDEIAENDSKNDLSDDNHYMADDEENGYSKVKTMDEQGNNYVSPEEELYDVNGNPTEQESDDYLNDNSNQEMSEEENGVSPENEQNVQQEEPENLDFEEENQEMSEEENGVSPENEQDVQQEEPENLDFEEEIQGTPEEENGTSPENEQDTQQEEPENLDFEEENQETPEEENGVSSENEQDSPQEQPEQLQDNEQDTGSSEEPSYSDADVGDSMSEDNSMSM